MNDDSASLERRFTESCAGRHGLRALARFRVDECLLAATRRSNRVNKRDIACLLSYAVAVCWMFILAPFRFAWHVNYLCMDTQFACTRKLARCALVSPQQILRLRVPPLICREGWPGHRLFLPFLSSCLVARLLLRVLTFMHVRHGSETVLS